ncbi:MAG: ATP--guanido phosphotransferase [candidate division WOR-3 bacterium]|nr:ATP--guanido phosphotransferase [candidate division WOR-3 bacterium]
MQFEDLIDTQPLWLNGEGLSNETVLSSRIRLARNLEGYLFPTRAREKELEDVSELVKDAVTKSPYFANGLSFKTKHLSQLDIKFVRERHLLSTKKRTVDCVVGKGEIVSVLINEEDHIRIQCLASGLNIKAIYPVIFEIDEILSSNLTYAFRNDFGYLTSCPTNVGTGMRVSCLLHLPGLVLTKEINKLLDDVMSRGFSVRGLYGEGSEIEGNFFQLSNQITLGIDEEEIATKTEKEIRNVIDLERETRNKLMREAGERVEDKIWRSYGILKNARMLSQEEFVNLSSAVRLGIGIGLIDNTYLKLLNYLLLYTAPAHLQKMKGKIMDADTRDIERASYVREVLKYN